MRCPPTRADDVRESHFGVEVRDPFRWLEDVRAPEVQAWMAEQDRFAREILASLPGRAELCARLKALYYLDSITAPLRRGSRYFYTRTHADREKRVVYWREGTAGDERVLLDPNTMSGDGTVSLGVWLPSYDGQRVVYALKANNSDEATLHVREVASGADSTLDVIDGAKYASPSWTPSGDGFYYTYLPSSPAIPSPSGRGSPRFAFIASAPPRPATR